MDPGTIGLIISAGGTIVGGLSAHQQGQYQSAIGKVNARQAEMNKQAAIEYSERDALDIGKQERGLLGEIIASQGASGISSSSPSFAGTRQRQAKIGQENQLRRVEAGYREGANFQTQANEFRARAEAASQEGKSALIGSFLNAGGTALSSPSFLGNAQPTLKHPDFLPVSRQRQMLRGSGRIYSSIPIGQY